MISMQKQFFFIFLIACSINLVSLSPVSQHKCEKNHDCLYNNICLGGLCKHKGYWPPNLSQIVELFSMCSLSMVATAAGVGGGGIYSALLMFIENFPAQIAFPISNFVILCCSLTTFYLGVRRKMECPDQQFVDYDLVVVFCPALLMGTKIGVILNSIFPALLLNILLILSLSFSSYKTYQNAIKVRMKEEKERLLQKENHQEPASNWEELENIDWEAEDRIIRPSRKASKAQDSFKSNHTIELDLLKAFEMPREADFPSGIPSTSKVNIFGNGDYSPIRLDRLKYVFILQAVMIVDQLLEGNSKIPSILGIAKCSVFFWGIFACFFSFCLYFTNHIYTKLRNEDDMVDNVIPSRASIHSDGFKITSEEGKEKINKIILFCFLGGIISGMLGIGGGIIMAPLMLELGINPKITTSTSNFLLIFTSSSGTFLYIMSGNLIFGYAVFFAIFCSVSSYFGSFLLNDYITKTGRNSILIWMVFAVILISLIILPINGIHHALYDLSTGADIFEVNSYCHPRM